MVFIIEQPEKLVGQSLQPGVVKVKNAIILSMIGSEYYRDSIIYILEYPDACVSNPCNNEGTCHVLSDGGYNCTCPLGFTGDICDHGGYLTSTNYVFFIFHHFQQFLYFWCFVEVDDCAGNPCSNDGVCVDVEGFNTFYCLCNSFYTGERCERS